MIKGLTVLNSSINGSRDLWWPRDHKAVQGYNIYRAFDAPFNWKKLNHDGPIPGMYYRDKTELHLTQFIVTDDAWIDRGQTGMYCFKLPDVPYAVLHENRPRVANSPDDVAVYVTDKQGNSVVVRPKMVSGVDQTVFLPVDISLPTGGAVSEFPIVDFSNIATVVAVYKTLTNFVDISLNLTRTFYTVVPVGAYGEEHPPGAFGSEVVNSMEVDRLDYTLAEMVRRNSWLFEQVGEPARLLLRRWHGERCACSLVSDFAQGRTACPVCYETGIVGGYYGPFDFLFIPPDVATSHTIDEGGIKVERPSASYLGRTPVVQDGDLILRANGERLSISGVTYKSPRGVLVQQQFMVNSIQPLDTRYLIPINEPECPLIYNPVSQTHVPGDGAQPLFSAKTVPGKFWENKDPQIGRSITWGRIQT